VVAAGARAQAAQEGFSDLPLVLAGFSFGSFVQTLVAQRLAQASVPAARLILVAPAVSRFAVAPVPGDTLVIHGETDDLVPLAAVFDWARPQALPILVVPGADHFFHHKLPMLKQIVITAVGAAAQHA
jgi:alpha/beta superfamily hydrolase